MPQCEATVSTPGRTNTGGQCKRNAVKGTTHCERHGGVEDAEARGLKPSHEPGSFRQRCTSLKRDGTPCSKWAIRGGFVCRTHGGNLPNVQQAARKRLVDLLPLAVQRLQTILESPETADGDALRAVSMLMDRTGLGAQSEVSIELKPYERLFESAKDGGIFRQVSDGEQLALGAVGQRVGDEDSTDYLGDRPVDVEVVEDYEPAVLAFEEPVAVVKPLRVGSLNPPGGSRSTALSRRGSRPRR